MSPEKVNVLLSVLQRAPVTQAEQIVCGEVAAWLVELVAEPAAAAAAQDKETRRQGDKEL